MPLIQDYNKLFEYTDDIKKVILNGNIVWPTAKPASGPDYTEPFYAENITNTSETLSIVKDYDAASTLTIEYSTNKRTWDTFGTTSTTALTMPLAPGDKVYLRCNTNQWNNGYEGNNITGVSKVGGNIMSLLYGDQFADKTSFPSGSTYNFYNLFYNNTNLVDASGLLLPATTLTRYCYQAMFGSCTSLTYVPELPAITLANNCYQAMFYGCTSLTDAPVLPATILAGWCYQSMFHRCTSLSNVPELPATTLINGCYFNMFRDCISLSNIICYATSGINTNSSTFNWLSGVSSTGTFTKAAGATWPSGANGIPSGWTVVDK